MLRLLASNIQLYETGPNCLKQISANISKSTKNKQFLEMVTYKSHLNSDFNIKNVHQKNTISFLVPMKYGSLAYSYLCYDSIQSPSPPRIVPRAAM